MTGRTGRGDGSLERTGGRAGDRVVEAFGREAPGGAREAAGAAGDRRVFHDGEDGGSAVGAEAPVKVAVSVSPLAATKR